MRCAATLLFSLLASLAFAGEPTPPPPQPEPEIAPTPPNVVTEAERARIESMLQKYASMKLKGLALKEQFRRRLIRPKGPDGEPIEQSADDGPHELGFQAAVPDADDAVELHLKSAEALGPRRYRLVLELTIPLESIGGYYRFSAGDAAGVPGIVPAVGWRIDGVSARVQILATLDLAWKMLENGNIGLYPGGFLDPDATDEERAAARLIEALRVETREIDLSRINVVGINGLRTFYRDGRPVGGGRLLQFVDGAAQRIQLETLIEGGINQAVRRNEPQLLEGINASLQSALPETQLQVTSFIEKLAIQANLPGKRPPADRKPPKPPPKTEPRPGPREI
jgi:hypothetical protein